MTADTSSLIRDLEDRDIHLWVDGDRLRVNAPAGSLTPDLRQLLIDHKPELVKALSVDWASDACRLLATCPDANLRSDLADRFEETAATLEYGCRLARAQSEMQAFGWLLYEVLRRGVDGKVLSA